jgi:hypothetical protein
MLDVEHSVPKQEPLTQMFDSACHRGWATSVEIGPRTRVAEITLKLPKLATEMAQNYDAKSFWVLTGIRVQELRSR